jgi:hypothetical protein
VGTEQRIIETYIEEGGNQATASAIINDKSKAFIIAVLVALNVLATVMMFMKWRDAETELRMLEYYAMELDGKLMAAGVIQPPESWSGRKQRHATPAP